MVVLSVVSSDYKVERTEEGSYPIVYLICRDHNRRRIIVKDSRFRPYFYVPKQEWDYDVVSDEDRRRVIEVKTVGRLELLEDSRKAVRVYTRLPSDVRKIRDILHNTKTRTSPNGIMTYEADVVYNYRYMIDKGIVNGIEIDDKYYRIALIDGTIEWNDKHCRPTECNENRLRILYIDIETDGDIDSTQSQIIAIGTYDSYTRQYRSFYWRLCNGYKSDHIVRYNSEKAMLRAFVDYVNSVEPDVIASFTPFDMVQIIQRLEVNLIPSYQLSPIGVVNAYDPSRVRIHGIYIVDIMEVYNRIERGAKFESLEAISMKSLRQCKKVGYAKRRLPLGSVSRTWNSDLFMDVIYYNLRDVYLIKELDREYSLIDYLFSISNITGSSLNDALYAARVADLMYLRLANSMGIVLPSRPLVKIRRTYSGGLVLDPVKGIHENVVVLDFKNLYPNVMRSFNIGWNTVDGSGDIVINDESGNEYRYTSKKKSWSVEILDRLRPVIDANSEELEKAKLAKDTELYKRLKRRRMALKSIVNGIYGVFGYAGNPEEHTKAARLYHPHIAASITAGARQLIEETIRITRDLGLDIVAGDTDSVMIRLGKTGVTDLEKVSKDVQNTIQTRLQESIRQKWKVDPSHFHLEIDTIFRRFIIFTKKRYAGLTIDGDIMYKGIEIVRREQSELTVELQSGLISMILNDVDKATIAKYTIDQLDRIKYRPVEELANTVVLSRPRNTYSSVTQILKAFAFANQILHLNIKEGERFYMVPIRPSRQLKVTVVLSKDGNEKDVEVVPDVAGFRKYSELLTLRQPVIIDWDKLIKTTVEKKIDFIIEMVGIDYNSLVRLSSLNKQKTLDLWSGG